MQYNKETTSILVDKVVNLCPRDQNLFIGLDNPIAWHYDCFYGRYVSSSVNLDFHDQFVGFFENTSRIRHSCSPNSFFSLDEEEVAAADDDPGDKLPFVIHAMRDIEEGEEITLYLLKGGGSYNERNYLHVAKFGRPCHCQLCLLPEDQRAVSDNRREVIATMFKDGESPTARGRERAMSWVKFFVNVLRMEDCIDISVPWAYHYGLIIARNFVDHPRIYVFLERIREHERRIMGRQSTATKIAHHIVTGFGAPYPSAETWTELNRLHTQLTPARFEEWLWREMEGKGDHGRYHDLRSNEYFLTFNQLPS
jgi:hypothetical protein